MSRPYAHKGLSTYKYHQRLLFLCLRFLEGSANQDKDNRQYLIEHIVETLKCGEWRPK